MDLITRKHEIIDEREEQMRLNWMCYKGGKAYIQKRLMRGLHEDDRSWKGDPKLGVLPRVQRTCYVPYAERVVDKIEEYIWSKPIKRDGADEKFTLNADRTGLSADQVLQIVQEYWTVCGWGWLNIDRTGVGGGRLTLREKELKNIGVYWTAYAPWEVPDWHYGADGRLEWAITEKRIYDNSNPYSEAKVGYLRTLWFPGHGVRFFLDKGRNKIGEGQAFTFSCKEVPFVRIGEITADPHWFDNVESMACKLLNLESEADTNLSKGVYSIPVVPSGVLEKSISEGLGKLAKDDKVTTDEVKTIIEKVFSRNHPIAEDADSKGVTRFVSPPSGDLNAHPNAVERCKKALYEVVGLGLSKQKDTADAESADAKAFDHLDINAVLRERALNIQRLEKRAVEMSMEFDSSFAKYEPIYPTEFSVGDPSAMVACAVQLSDLGVALPAPLVLALVRAITEMIPNVSEDERLEIEQAAEKMLDEQDEAIKRIAKAALAAGKTGAAGGGGEPPKNDDGDGGATPPQPGR